LSNTTTHPTPSYASACTTLSIVSSFVAVTQLENARQSSLMVERRKKRAHALSRRGHQISRGDHGSRDAKCANATRIDRPGTARVVYEPSLHACPSPSQPSPFMRAVPPRRPSRALCRRRTRHRRARDRRRIYIKHVRTRHTYYDPHTTVYGDLRRSRASLASSNESRAIVANRRRVRARASRASAERRRRTSIAIIYNLCQRIDVRLVSLKRASRRRLRATFDRQLRTNSSGTNRIGIGIGIAIDPRFGRHGVVVADVEEAIERRTIERWG